MIERGLREFPEEADKMTDVISYPFGYTAVLVGEAFSSIDDLYKRIVNDELVVGGVSVVGGDTLTLPFSVGTN